MLTGAYSVRYSVIRCSVLTVSPPKKIRKRHEALVRWRSKQALVRGLESEREEAAKIRCGIE